MFPLIRLDEKRIHIKQSARFRSLEGSPCRFRSTGWSAVTALSLLSTLLASSVAGPNEAGVLLVHSTPPTQDIGLPTYCGLSVLVDCAGANTTLPGNGSTRFVWWVRAVFPEVVSPRLTGVAFGIDYDSESVVIGDHGICGDTGIYTCGPPYWPEPGSGIFVVWTEPQTSRAVDVYWFAGYEYYGNDVSFTVTPDPIHGGVFSDDSRPAKLDPIADYGSLGFNLNPGYNPCPDPTGIEEEIAIETELADDTGLRLAILSSNPSAEGSDLQLSVPRDGHLQVGIHAVDGQRIRNLVDEWVEAETHDLRWDGKTEDGHRASPGVYFVKVTLRDTTGRDTRISGRILQIW